MLQQLQPGKQTTDSQETTALMMIRSHINQIPLSDALDSINCFETLIRQGERESKWGEGGGHTGPFHGHLCHGRYS